jgi:hypothetical protein
MHAFTRLTSFVLFVLSLGFLTCALPTPASSGSNDLAVRHGDAPSSVVALVVGLEAKVKVHVDAIGRPSALLQQV